MATEFYNRNWRMPNSWNGSTDNNSKVSNYSMSFDGSEFIDTNSTFNTLTSFSISVWFKADDTAGTVRSIVSTRANGLSTSKGLDIYISANVLTGRVYDNGATEVTQSFTDTSSWHNVVMTYDGTTLELFLDNSSIGTATGSYDSTGATNLIIGKFTVASSYYFDGKIDHLAIFDYALSASQVTALYGNSTDGVGNPMSLSAKPKFYYPIGDYAAFNGSEYLVPNGALSDYVFDFNGSTSYITYNRNPSISTSNVTISGWFKTDKTSGTQGIVGSGGNDGMPIWLVNGKLAYYQWTSGGWGPNMIYNVVLNTNEWYHFAATWDESTTTRVLYLNGEAVLTNTTTTDLVWVNNYGYLGRYSSSEFDGQLSNIQIYNSTLPATGSNSIQTLYNNGTPLETAIDTSNLYGWWKLDASATFDGSNWSIPDDSSNSNTGTSSGMTAANLVQSNLLITQPYSRYALDFDGTGDKIDLGLLSFLNNVSAYTLSMWVNPSTLSGLQYLFAIVTSSTERIYINLNNTLPNVGMSNGTNTNESFSSSPLTVNNWHHLSIVFDGTQTGASRITFYLDGVAQTTTKTTWDSTTPTFVTNAFLGNYAQYSLYYFNGKMSNVSIFDSALTSTQVTELYNQGKPGNLNNHSAYSNLVSWWQLGENMSYDGAVWTVLDEKGTNNGTGANLAPAEDAIVNGVGTTGNGLSDGMGGADNIIGDAPYSTANAVSYGMGVDAKSTDVPS